jgi:YHS domain-containing protein
MKVLCNQCGKILDLMKSTSFVADEAGQLKSYHFCSEEHMKEFARRKEMAIGAGQ